MKFSILFVFVLFATICYTTFAADNNSSESTENLLSNDTTSNSNNTDASDGNLTIEEQYEGENGTLTSNSTVNPSTKKGSSSPVPMTTTNGVKTTTPKPGKPKGPKFTVWSFFIGIFVAFLIIGLAAFLVKFFCQKRATGNNVPYTAYQ